MSGFEELLGSALGGGALSKIAAQLGTDEAGAHGAVSAALPQILGQLQSNASTPEGADALHKALAQHDGSVLDNVAAHLDGGDANGAQAKIVSKVFADNHESEVNALAGKTGLSSAGSAGLLGMLAPLVLGALTKSGAGAGGAGGLGSILGGLVGGGAGGGGLGSMLGGLLGGGAGGGLGGMLGGVLGGAGGSAAGAASQLAGSASGAASSAASSGGGVIGQITNALDRDGDGNPMNDVQAMAKSGFGQKLLGFFRKG
jgi:hypothetical protein